MRIPREKVAKVDNKTNYLILVINLTLSQQNSAKRENLLRKVLSFSWTLDKCSTSMKKTASKYSRAILAEVAVMAMRVRGKLG